MKKLCLLLVLSFLLTACGGNASNVPAEESNSVPPASAISENTFALPEGYTLENMTETSCDIIRDGTCVGSIVRTELDPNVIATADSDAILGYLESYVSEGMDYEYMMGHAGENTSLLRFL